MSSKPETAFIKSIHDKIKQVHAEKNNNPYRSGTADVWYSGVVGDLWVEYKFIPRIPRSNAILPDLTPRQRRWLKDRHADGRNVAVILGVGSPAGGVVYRNRDWEVALTSDQLEARILQKGEVAQWILNQTGASACHTRQPCLPQPKSSRRRTKF